MSIGSWGAILVSSGPAGQPDSEGSELDRAAHDGRPGLLGAAEPVVGVTGGEPLGLRSGLAEQRVHRRDRPLQRSRGDVARAGRFDRGAQCCGIPVPDGLLGRSEPAVAIGSDLLTRQDTAAVRRAERVEHVGVAETELGVEVPLLSIVVEKRPDVVVRTLPGTIQDPLGRQPVAALVTTTIRVALSMSVSGRVSCRSGSQRFTSMSGERRLELSGASWRRSLGAWPRIS